MRSLPEPAMPASEPAVGCIFDIQRFSTHDGSGIRTNVFFKGCPLRCAWCQNPEGLRPEPEVVWLETSCIHCGTCTDLAHGALTWDTGRLKVQQCPEADWSRLVPQCPAAALRYSGRHMTVAEVMEVVRRDVPFYRHGGGGVTLSGGDPVLQSEFAGALLRACRLEGIHTAMETEAALPWERIEPLLADLDQIFIDLKLLDPQQARKYTGRGPEQTLANLTQILKSCHREKVTVRTPLIPGITATAANLEAAAAFLSALSRETSWELLNYNTLAPAKYPLVGRSYPLDRSLAPFTAGEMRRFAAVAEAAGMRRVHWDGQETEET